MGKAEVDKLVTRALKQNAVELVVHESELNDPDRDPDSLSSQIGKLLRKKKAVFLTVRLPRPPRVKYEYALYEPWPNKAGVRRTVASFSKRKPSEKKKAPAKIKTKPQIQREYDAKQAKKKDKQAQRLWDAYAKGRDFHAKLTFLGTTVKGNQSQKVWELFGRSNGYATIQWGKIGSLQGSQDLPIATALKRAEEKLKKGYAIASIRYPTHVKG